MDRRLHAVWHANQSRALPNGRGLRRLVTEPIPARRRAPRLNPPPAALAAVPPPPAVDAWAKPSHPGPGLISLFPDDHYPRLLRLRRLLRLSDLRDLSKPAPEGSRMSDGQARQALQAA